MVEVKKMSGILNLDSPYESFPPFHHRHLLNGRFRESGGGMQLQRIPGNILIPNYLLPAGTNQCIGALYDAIKKRIIWWNFNSNGRNGIYQYSLSTNTLSKVFLCFTDSATDVLGLNRNYPIHSANIVYRSDSEGDLLYWTDNNERPKYLNLATVSDMAPFTASMLYVAKDVPLVPPACAYGDDSNVNTNNLRSKLFRFSQRWHFKNGEVSTMSAYSKVPMPVNGYNQDTINDPTKNNVITVTLNGGPSDFQKVELLVQNSEGNVWSDWQSVDTLDRDQYSIAVDGTYDYSFYNNAPYPYIDPADATLYWDRVPDKAATQELLNGCQIIYGNTTDGYTGLTREDIDVTLTTGLAAPNVPTIAFAYSGANVFTMQIGATITAGITYNVQFTYSSGAGGDASPKNVNYVTLGGDTLATVAAGLAAAIQGSNIDVDNLGSGMLRVRTSTGAGTITNVVVSVNTGGAEVAAPSFLWRCSQRFGIQYLDQWDKPVGGVYSYVADSALDTTDFAVTTPDFATNSNTVQVPFIAMTIDHTPPTGAVSYHIVRANLTPKFLHWVTNDYADPLDGYIYFCIQNLYYQNTQNSGFLPTYDFAKGDRVIVLASYNGTTNQYTAYDQQLDFEIVGLVDKNMSFPADPGKWLKVVKPTTFPSSPYANNMLIQIYTPPAQIPNDALVFHEWGEKYDIYESGGIRYHRGQLSDQTAAQPASFQWFDGDVYFKQRILYKDPAAGNETAYMMDANYNDYFASAVNSNGRGWLINEDAQIIVNNSEIRWGGAYDDFSSDNQLNRFRPENIDVLDRSKGPILRMLSEERLLYIYHARGVGSIGIYGKYVKNNQGEQELIVSDEIITKNNIYYLAGGYGLGDQPCGLFRGYNFAHYFYDPVRGSLLRRSGDGITDLTELYLGQYTIRDMVAKYNVDYTRVDGSKAKLLGFFDFLEGNAHFIMQGGTFDGETIPSRNLTFNERKNAFRGLESWQPEWALQAGKVTFSWKDGSMWIHNDETNWCRFYGKDYPTEITLLFTGAGHAELNKIFNAVGYDSELKIWECSRDKPLSGVVEEAIRTSFINPQTGLRQTSRLKNFNFSFDNGKYSAGLLRDINSSLDRRLGLWEGDFLEGVWMEATFIYSGSDFATFDDPYCSYQISNRNY